MVAQGNALVDVHAPEHDHRVARELDDVATGASDDANELLEEATDL